MQEFALLSKKQAKLRKLTEVSRALTCAVSLSDVLYLGVNRACELLDTDKAVLLLSNQDGILKVGASCGLSPLQDLDAEQQIDTPPIDYLETILNVPSDLFLAVPLVAGSQVTGILAVSQIEASARQEDAEWLLSALADQVAVALEMALMDETAQFRERLIGIVSHDLRAPITAILSLAQSLLHRKQTPARVQRAAQRIQECAKRATGMIYDLLDFTQMHLGPGIPLKLEKVQLAAVIDQVVAELAMVRPKRVIKKTITGSICGQWDASRLAQVMSNLLNNALSYSPEDTPVEIRGHLAAGMAILEIHNAGEPISALRLPHIFEPMQRGTSHSSPQRSVGLGLYIARNIIDAHRGSIEVKSCKSAGTVVTVLIPCDPSHHDEMSSSLA